MDAHQEKRVNDGVAAASKSSRAILRDIQEVAEDVATSNQDILIKRTMARFATLLVNLSEQADKITHENLSSQRKLVFFNLGTPFRDRCVAGTYGNPTVPSVSKME